MDIYKCPKIKNIKISFKTTFCRLHFIVKKHCFFDVFHIKIEINNKIAIYFINPNMSEQRIRECLEALENLYITNGDQTDSIVERIRRIAFEVNNQYEYRMNLSLLEELPSELTYQQVLYQLISRLTVSEPDKHELTIKLLGENDEYLLEGEGLYTDELYNKVYEIIVKEHMDSWRSYFFDEADLEGDEVERHAEYVAYAKKHGL